MPEPDWVREQLGGWLFEESSPLDDSMSSAKMKVVIGGFYEHLTTKLLAAEHGKCPVGWSVYPDVVKRGKGKQRDLLVEVKGASRKYGFVVDHGQCREYARMDNWVMPFYHPAVYYMFFVHNVERPKANCATVGDMVKALSEHTVCALLMPLPLVQRMMDWLPFRTYAVSDYGSRGSEGHEFFSLLTGQMIERWCHSTLTCRQELEQLAVKAADEAFSWNGWTGRSRVVSDQVVAGFKVNSFLLTSFTDKDWRVKL